MPCGKRPLVKVWEKPRDIRAIKPSRYQQNEASVKVHWIRTIKELELRYKDDKFWETQSSTVRGLVGPIIFERLAKIFNLTIGDKIYYPESEPSVVVESEKFYEQFHARESVPVAKGPSVSVCDLSEPEKHEGEEEEEEEEEEEPTWSASSTAALSQEKSKTSRQKAGSKSQVFSSKSLLRVKSRGDASFKSFSRFMSRTMSKTFTKPRPSSGRLDRDSESFSDVIAFTDDDIIVHANSYAAANKSRPRSDSSAKGPSNPHFTMLYCNESEVDMIKWKSKYKTKKFQVSASDEYSMKADLLTKEISHEFYTWWEEMGSPEYKSDIKRMGDIEDLFQVHVPSANLISDPSNHAVLIAFSHKFGHLYVWFNEHASRGLVLDPKILPCVLETIAKSVGVPQSSCPKALKRQLAWDIHAETSPAHTLAFNAPLPHKLKHIPPKNDTAESWHPIRIPEDLRSMSTVWQDISHLTSTKAFHKWLEQRPYMPMPPCLKALGKPQGDKKQPFVVPSDYVIRDKSMENLSSQELNIPVSQFSMEIKEVLSRLLSD